MAPRLFGTHRSHFTRIVRVLLHELELDVEWVDVGNVGAHEAFGGNPLMQVPVLVEGNVTVWDSHEICRYLVARRGRDPLGVESLDWARRNLVTVIRGVMSAEVRLILATRAGMDVSGGVFDKDRDVIDRALAWIDEHIGAEPAMGSRLTYPAVCAVAMWDHLLLYENAEVDDAPQLDSFVSALRGHPSIARTRPG